MRKKITILLSFLLLSFYCFSQTTTTEKLIGKWVGTDAKKATGFLQILDSANAVINFPGHGTFTGTYSIDLKNSPMLFKFIFRNGNKKMQFTTLLLWVNATTMKWQKVEDDEEIGWKTPETKGNTLLLKKQ